MKETNKPKIAVNIVHVNGEEILNNCLKSLKKTNYPNFEINILFNATTDHSERIAIKYNCKVFKSRKNLGFAGGHNLLAKKTKSDYIAIINNDIEVEKNWLKEMANFSIKNNAEIIQPKIKWLRDRSYFEAAGACGGFMDKYGYEFYRGRIFGNVEKDAGQYNKPIRIFWACGSCMFIKRTLIDKIGLFDEEFFMYSEEFDFCWRANIFGAKIFCVPSSVIHHLGSFSIKLMEMSGEKEYLLHRNVLITFLKNYSDENIKKYLSRRIMLEVLSGIAFPKKFMPVSRALIWIIKNRRRIKNNREKIQKLRKVKDEEYQDLILKKSIAYLHFVKRKDTFKEVEKYF